MLIGNLMYILVQNVKRYEKYVSKFEEMHYKKKSYTITDKNRFSPSYMYLNIWYFFITKYRFSTKGSFRVCKCLFVPKLHHGRRMKQCIRIYIFYTINGRCR